MRGLEHESGLVVAGGKGGVSRKTPAEIEAASAAGTLAAEPARLVYASKMAAKVDSAGLQDGFQIYHHSFFFTRDGRWAVVQQGMNDANGMARRYHWLSDSVTDFVVEPHQAIASQAAGTQRDEPGGEDQCPGSARGHRTVPRAARPGDRATRPAQGPVYAPAPCRRIERHPAREPQESVPLHLRTAGGGLRNAACLPGVGPKTIRALALIAELVYDTPASRSDPALFSYAHGGKDGFPYPVDRPTYDRNIEILGTAVARAKIGRSERMEALKRLAAISRRAEVEGAGKSPA